MVSRVEELAKKKGHTMAQIAAAWAMNRDSMSVWFLSLEISLIMLHFRCHCTNLWNDKPEELGRLDWLSRLSLCESNDH